MKMAMPLSTARRKINLELHEPAGTILKPLVPAGIPMAPQMARAVKPFAGDIRLYAEACNKCLNSKGDAAAINYITRGRLREFRKIHHLSTQELSELLGIPDRKLFRWLAPRKDDKDIIPLSVFTLAKAGVTLWHRGDYNDPPDADTFWPPIY